MTTRTIASLAAALLLCAGGAHAGSTITGAGATFPYPIYAKWAHDYNAQTGVKLNYQSIGSGGGVKQIKAGTVDFGASDAPLSAAELKTAGLVQFPMVMGGVVPVVNLEGVGPGQLKLDAATLAGIFQGAITTWNDPAIAALNPDAPLTGAITVVHRADGSGTTWIFSNYLTKVSERWASAVGTGKSVSWPVGVGGKGNEGVAAFVSKLNGAIGYVEYAYALQNQMATVQLRNRDGRFVAPTASAFQAAAAGADWSHAEGFSVVLTDQPGAEAWPITGASFILVHARQRRPEQGVQVLTFFDWAYQNGSDDALALDYVPMPAAVADLVRAAWSTAITAKDGTPLWPVR